MLSFLFSSFLAAQGINCADPHTHCTAFEFEDKIVFESCVDNKSYPGPHKSELAVILRDFEKDIYIIQLASCKAV